MATEIIQLKGAVTRLIKAEIAASWKGGGDPADIPRIEQELNNARTNYNSKMERLERAHSAALSGHAPDFRGLGC